MEPYLQLEKEYAEFVGSQHSIGCNSGTSALHLSLLALGVGSGDEVIVPDFTMAACAFAVSYTGATPVFVDVLPNGNIDPEEVKKAITNKTKAIMVVHVYGRLADIDAIQAIAWQIPIIEDACEAHGAVYRSKAALTCYSFYRNKIIHAEEGGMVTTNNEFYANRIRYYKNMAFGERHDYFHSHVGYNYRMPNAQAFLALVSLKLYPENSDKRRQIESWYNEELGRTDTRDAVWFYDHPASKDILEKVPSTRDSFKPLSSFPMYGGKGLPVATRLSKELVLLPVNPGMDRKSVHDICSLL